MSVDLSKLNRPGTASSFGSASRARSGVSSQATKNLANSSAANKSSLFSLKSGPKTNWVAGTSIDRNTSKYNYQGIRQRLNSGQVRDSRFYGTGSVSKAATNTNFTIDNNSAYQKGMMAAQIIGGAFNMLNKFGVFDSLKADNSAPVSNTKALDAAMGSLGGISTASTVSSSAASSAIASMSGATDSASLRQAIESAKSAKADLPNVVASESTFEQEKTKLKGEVDSLKGEVKTAEKDVEKKQQAVGQAGESVKSMTMKRDTAKNVLTQAMTRKNQCSTAYAQARANTISAQTALTSAQAVANATPEYIDGPNGTKIKNPAYDRAQAELANAKKALADAQKAEEQAKTEFDKANEAAVKADKDVQKAEQDLKTAQEQLDKAKDSQTKAKEALEQSKKNLEAKETALEAKENELDTLKQKREEYEKLENEIPKQEKRLAELEKKEQEQYGKLNNKITGKIDAINERQGQIDPSNGMNLGERMKQNRNERANAKVDRMEEEKAKLQDNLVITNLLNDNTNVQQGINGEELRTGQLPSGRTAYFVGDKEVLQAEYEALLKK